MLDDPRPKHDMSNKTLILGVLAAVLCAIVDGLLMADPNAVMKLLKLK